MANTTKFIAGVAYVSVDGVQQMLVGDLSWSPSKVKRETLAGMDGVHGYKETPVAGFIAGTFRDSSGMTVADINAMRDVTVVAELSNGKTIIAQNAWSVDVQEVKSTEGTLDVRWESLNVEEA